MICTACDTILCILFNTAKSRSFSLDILLRGYESGVSCSKLTMSLVNDLLKFQMVILQIHCYFLLTKCEMCNAKDAHILSTKNNSVFAFVVDI